MSPQNTDGADVPGVHMNRLATTILLGIFAYVLSWMGVQILLEYGDPLHRFTLLPLPAIVVAILLITWILCALGHRHAFWARATALYAGVIGAGGVFTLGCMLLLILNNQVTGLAQPLALVLLAVSVLLGICVLLVEVLYRWVHTPHEVPMLTRGLVRASAIVVAVAFVVLLIASFIAASLLIAELHPATRMARDRGDYLIEGTLPSTVVKNSFLSATIRAHEMRWDEITATRPEPLGAGEFLTDSWIGARCDLTMDASFVMLQRITDQILAERWQEFPPNMTADLDAYHNIPGYSSSGMRGGASILVPFNAGLLGFQTSGFRDGYACITRLVDNSEAKIDASRRAYLPTDPDMSDPAQRELVAFAVWMHAQQSAE